VFCITLLCSHKRTEFGKPLAYRGPVYASGDCQWCGEAHFVDLAHYGPAHRYKNLGIQISISIQLYYVHYSSSCYLNRLSFSTKALRAWRHRTVRRRKSSADRNSSYRKVVMHTSQGTCAKRDWAACRGITRVRYIFVLRLQLDGAILISNESFKYSWKTNFCLFVTLSLAIRITQIL
jgi:hypothetical protein